MIESITFRMKQGNLIHKVAGKMLAEGGRLYLHFGYNKTLISEIKSMEGHHWHGNIAGSDYRPKPLPPAFLAAAGTDKCWSVANSSRNRFQLQYLLGDNPYHHYDQPLPTLEFLRKPYEHQKEMTAFLVARKRCIIAGEMGTGKTLCVIETMERSGFADWWYVAPRSVIKTIQRELRIWDCKIKPELMTYNKLTDLMKHWPEGAKPPRGVVLDESARGKNPTSQRSQAMMKVADLQRMEWGDICYIIEMSGAPAPKAPTDWWHQCEVACPGFLKEGSLSKFKVRLGVFKEEQSFSGGVFLKQITWLDDEEKCAVCGQLPNALEHIPGAHPEYHIHVPSVNEVRQLYKRMNGLVMVKFKKDCLDLPDKIYREIDCKPTPSILRAASMIARTSPTTIQALTLLRELSDGFQYEEEKNGTEKCPLCQGSKKYIEKQPTDVENQYVDVEVDCPACNGNGERDRMVRIIKQVPCPKEDELRDVLDEHSEIGRLVTYAGFTGSVERCVQTSLSEKWGVIRVDGRGWKLYLPDGQETPAKPDFLSIFQDQLSEYPRINFVGQAAAAGSGHTLTASPTIFYYSNDFNADSRIQSEDRIHRIGMDKNRGATIIDVFHLPVDRLVYNNLKKKRELQAMSLGEIVDAMKVAEADDRLF